ncbi:hypothetical protein EXS70_05105 [Candidatus Peribacteria bacterium]|nr:hypothetical protein [Candidatus Peribacteria bacterium]
MNLSELTQLVTGTPLLTEPERTYWLSHLPTMKPEQCSRLEQILSQPVELPFGDVITGFFQSMMNKHI